MKQFKVAVNWMMVHEVTVSANSIEEAIKMVENNEIDIDPDCDGCYLDDSFEVNLQVTEELNNE